MWKRIRIASQSKRLTKFSSLKRASLVFQGQRKPLNEPFETLFISCWLVVRLLISILFA